MLHCRNVPRLNFSMNWKFCSTEGRTCFPQNSFHFRRYFLFPQSSRLGSLRSFIIFFFFSSFGSSFLSYSNRVGNPYGDYYISNQTILWTFFFVFRPSPFNPALGREAPLHRDTQPGRYVARSPWSLLSLREHPSIVSIKSLFLLVLLFLFTHSDWQSVGCIPIPS